MIPFLILAIGLFLILAEFYLPGGIIGIFGGIFIISSIILFASQTQSTVAVVLFFVGAAVGLILVIRFALNWIVKAKPGYSIYLNKDQAGYQASAFDKEAIGKIGEVISDLKPGGYILVDGKQHQALSLTGYIAKGDRVQVVGGQEESLTVIHYVNESQ